MTTLDTGGVSMTWAHGPVVTRRRLGGELKRLRDAAGLKLEDVARVLECSTSKISRLENGKGIPRARDVRDMLEVYGVHTGDVRERLIDWAHTGQQRLWWQGYADILSAPTATYVELEWDAVRIRAYEPHIVHGLLQTPSYAMGVLSSIHGVSRSRRDIERLLEVRMRRQEALDPAHGLDFHCCLDESTLYRAVESPAVLAEQLTHLLDVMGQGTVDVRVLPFSAGLVPAARQPFARIEFSSDAAQSDVVYLEGPWGAGEFQSEPADLTIHEASLTALSASSLGGADATGLIRRALDSLQSR